MEKHDVHFIDKYENIIITDEQGMIIFCDVADLNVLRAINSWPEDIIGKHITSFYQDLDEENSTIIRALNSGEELVDIEQVIQTTSGDSVTSISSTFPIKINGEIIGAIEFSNRFFENEHVQSLDQVQTHQMYRKNNTIFTIDDLITNDEDVLKIKERIKRIALNTSSTLIYGETGTGKEIIAQGLHNASKRFVHPFISLNCSAIPETLIEGTLFGTVKGSFTGAEDRPGLLEQAHKGTLFLDEVNSLPIHVQVKLLKAIEEKSVRRVGGSKNIHSDFFLISAMNETPELLIQENRLREDLYYRLNATEIYMPPLRERKGDVTILVDHFIRFYNRRMMHKITEIEEGVMEHLQNYHWPGNVRELKNAIETVYNHMESNTMTVHDLPRRIQNFITTQPVLEETTYVLKDQLDAYEKSLIEKALARNHGIYADAANELHISRQSLHYKMKKYELL